MTTIPAQDKRDELQPDGGAHLLLRFIAQVRARLNARVFLRCLSGGMLGIAFGMSTVGAAFVLRGHAVDPLWLLMPLGAGVTAMLTAYVMLRVSPERAVVAADKLFNLHESLSSALGFARQGRRGPFYSLQLRDALGRVHGLDPRSMTLAVSWRPFVAVALWSVLAFVLASFGDSAAVVADRRERRQTAERTREANKEIRKELAEIERELTEEERELFREFKFERIADSLDIEEERAEALRQYAELEKRLRDAEKHTETRQDEQFLSETAKELLKDSENRTLAKALENKNYEKAADEVRKFTQKKPPPSAGKRRDLAEKALAEMRRRSRTLAKASKRMNDSAKRPGAGSRSDFRELAKKLNNNVSALDKNLTEADKAMEELSKMDLANMDLSEEGLAGRELTEEEKKMLKELSKCDSKLCKSCDKANASLGKLGEKLDKLAARRRFLARLRELRKCLGRSQSYVLGQCSSPASGKGGKKAGTGSDRSERDDAGERLGEDQGQSARIRGIAGAGPSEAVIEEAAFGSGVSRRAADDRAGEFRRQVEALVRREDVPEDLKDGVRRYFEAIHEQDSPVQTESNDSNIQLAPAP